MSKLYDIVNAEYISDYKIVFTFENGEKKLVNLENMLWGEVFEPLKDRELFKQFKVNKEYGTIVWPNGADVAPDGMYEIGIPVSENLIDK
jgi:hypothetical protein